MSTAIVVSVMSVPIRLTDERWAHIVEEHAEVAGLRDEILQAISHPGRILAGGSGEFLAIRAQRDGKTLVVVYRETGDDGFIITAFVTSRMRSLERRRQLWP